MRGAALAVVPADYVTAARARGESTWSILRREVLPNITDVVCVEFAMRASWVVLLISSLSFLGFGADPPTPDWGLMVAENRTAITVVPMASIAPIIALATLVRSGSTSRPTASPRRGASTGSGRAPDDPDRFRQLPVRGLPFGRS
ncbi:ABC transporter permease [Streptomyces sp. L7]